MKGRGYEVLENSKTIVKDYGDKSAYDFNIHNSGELIETWSTENEYIWF